MAFVKKCFNLPGEEAPQEEAASGKQGRTAQPCSEQDNFVNHLTASLYGPDEICTSAGR